MAAEEVGGDGSSSGVPSGSEDTVSIKEATVLVYMVGADLESSNELGTADIQEMMDGLSSDLVNWVVTTGGADKDGWRTVSRFQLRAGEKQKLADLGPKNMGDPNTLRDFLVWGVSTYPAEVYHVILWDHGAGREGFGADEVFGGDNLSLEELEEAFSDAKSETGVVFETIGFDACLMATLEVASILAPYGRYMIASENTEPGYGWYYVDVASAISANPGALGASLGKSVADSYLAYARSRPQLDPSTVTLSVIDLSAIADVREKFDALFEEIKNDFEVEPASVAQIVVGAVREATKFPLGTKNSPVQTTDLIHAMELIDAEYPEAAYVAEAARAAIVYSVRGDLVRNANGLAFYNFVDDGSILENASYQYAWSSYMSYYYGLAGIFFEYMSQDYVQPVFAAVEFGDTGQIVADIVEENLKDVYVVIAYADLSTGGEFLIGWLPVGANEMTVSGNVTHVVTEIDTTWVTMEGNLVPAFVEQSEEGQWIITTEALLNGISVDILSVLELST